jgi:predicted PhzF superfamily epimerase YddE/YHI9
MEYFIVDAFADKVFSGNPAGVCVVEEPLSEDMMQNIAAENNLSETAFVLRKSLGHYDLRWFTPKSEIDLCGHATLATAFVVSNFVDDGLDVMEFSTLSGVLSIVRNGDEYVMDFPAIMPRLIDVPLGLESALGVVPIRTWLDRDLVVLVENEDIVKSLRPDFSLLCLLKEGLGVIVTAKGVDCDFVSRCFYPKLGVNEDPVTGSAHCFLAPLWKSMSGQDKLIGRQLSSRGGIVACEIVGNRVYLSGKAVLYLQGELLTDG